MARRLNGRRDAMMSVWSKTALALGIFLSLVAVVSTIGNGFRFPWKTDLLTEQLNKWRVETHEQRIAALEIQVQKLVDGQEEQRKATSSLKDSIQLVGTDLKVGMTEIKTIVSGMAAGVDNAQRVALRAETLAIGQNVDKDFRDNAVQPQPQMMRGKP